MHPSETSREQFLALSGDPALRRRFAVVNDPIPGNLRFGVLLEVLDVLGGMTAWDYADRFLEDAHVVTAAIDEIVVRRVADVSDDLRCLARINRVGRSSMEVGIRVEASPAEAHVATCYFTFVARQGETTSARSVALPALEPVTDDERRRDARAVARREAWSRAAASAGALPSEEELLHLRDLHQAQDAPGFSGLRAADLATETWERTYPEQENLSKVIFGGFIIRRALELSHMCAERVAPDRPILAAVNRVNFFHPVQIGDKLHMTARVAMTQGPAVCIETAIERISRDRTVRALSNSCLFTFVNVDTSLAPRDLPMVYPTTYREDARYLEARRNLASLAVRAGPRWILPALREGRASPTR